MEHLLEQIKSKYQTLGQDPETYLKGLLHTSPINYWDYVQVDTLLTLQKPKTAYKDEFIFIVYHQITELVLRLIVHELQQLTASAQPDDKMMIDKLGRLNRYIDMLITSFSVMNKGMSYDDYNEFRLALAPASGFQSAQFRIIEIYCTGLDNLIPPHRKAQNNSSTNIREKFELLYWQDAGKDHKTGKKSLTLSQFENRYMDEFVRLADNMQTTNLNERIKTWIQSGKLSDDLKTALKSFDVKFNIEWPMVHLETAHTYLGKGQGEKAATGGSHWEKYLHPKHQKRIFFPGIYTTKELDEWGT